ncbi:translation factor [Bordetella pertussis]|nr:translation factor [Bordetella pertussis]
MALAPAPAGLSADVHWRMAPAGPARYAQALYAGYARILVEQPPRSGDWDAVNDRIGRAAAAFSLDTTDLPGT